MAIAHHAPPRDSQPRWLRLAFFASVLLAVVPALAVDRPNILVILADDLGYSDIGCFGGEIRTPHIDALAADGLQFTQFYNATRCCPSRASLLTGLYPHQAGVGSMTRDEGPQRPGYRGHLTERCVTIPEVLRSAGYRTSMVGKWHLGGNPGPIRRGFDDFYGMIGGFNSFWQEDPFYTRLPAGRPKRTYPPGQFYSTDAFADYALDFLAESRRDSSRPWFLYLAFNAPHFPLHAPKAEVDRYASIYEKGWDAIREERLARMKRLGIVAADVPLTPRSDWDHPFHHKEGVNPAWDSLPADRRVDLARRMAIYAAMVEHMDSAIGRVIASLKEHGQLDNTLILFLSDNGGCGVGPTRVRRRHRPEDHEHSPQRGGGPRDDGGSRDLHQLWLRLGQREQHPLAALQTLCPRGGHQYPARRPLAGRPEAEGRDGWSVGAHRGRHGHMCGRLGARHPAGAERREVLPMEGRSLVPALRGEPESASRTLFWEHEGHRAVRDGRWKLVARKGQAWELYDIEVDRAELHDLAAREPRRVARLATAWDEWAARCFVFREAAPSGAAKASPKPEGVGGIRP